MATVFDVARYILHQTGPITTWKLQKLCYYAQAWHLAWTDRPLFEEDFEAWRNGPVCPALYALHRGQYHIEEDDIYDGHIENLTDDERESIDIVLNGYAARDPYELREQTHSEAPWRDARGSLPENAPSTALISKDSMAAYYASL